MSVAPVAAPAMSALPAALDARAGASAATTFLQVLEEEMLREAVPTSLPPPTFPLPVPGSLPPEYPWMPMPLILLPPHEERTVRKRPPARKERQPGRR
jgi:hypothetical protein